MRGLLLAAVVSGLTLGLSSQSFAQQPRSFRLKSVDLTQSVIWGAECRQPDGTGLAFGGQHQNADDGRPHTRLLVERKWQAIDEELRAANPLQQFHNRTWQLRDETKNLLAYARAIYFQGSSADKEAKLLASGVVPQVAKLKEGIERLSADLPMEAGQSYTSGQVKHARGHLEHAQELLPVIKDELNATSLTAMHRSQIQLELAAENLAAEPPARAMDCELPYLAKEGEKSNEVPAATSRTLVYEPLSKLYILFGGDHLDYLTNDTWVFDPAERQWFQRHPNSAPPPRANHRLEAIGEGKVRLVGGFTYSSSTDYLGGQYIDLNDGEWLYDLTTNEWTGGKPVAADTRVYRTGPFHPDFYFAGPKPNAAEFEAWLNEIPNNKWVPTNPPHLPQLNRDWGTARIDPDRDLMLRWSGGHSAHGGSDVLHFHFATNRWELSFPVEFPLGQLYSNTSYPNGFNFNLRPWITGHTYQNYDYDSPSKKMIFAGRPRYTYAYDPDVGDWTGREIKPQAMQYNSCFYTLTLGATPQGVVCWDKNGKVHRYEQSKNNWVELEVSGDQLPGAYVDNSSIAYDSKRDRMLMVNTLGYGKPFDGQIWELDLKSLSVKRLRPLGSEHAVRFANVDKCCYDPVHDFLLLGTFLKDAADHTRTPAYHCSTNRWVTIDLKYLLGSRNGNIVRKFPHGRSDGMMFDPLRKLVWGTNADSQVYVLRNVLEPADLQPLN